MFNSKVDCTWSEWEYVTTICNCGRGFRDKRRIEYKEKYGGKPCDGEPEATEPCKEDDCPGIKSFILFMSLINFDIIVIQIKCSLISTENSFNS